jgi:hypothetical protein
MPRTLVMTAGDAVGWAIVLAVCSAVVGALVWDAIRNHARRWRP